MINILEIFKDWEITLYLFGAIGVLGVIYSIKKIIWR